MNTDALKAMTALDDEIEQEAMLLGDYFGAMQKAFEREMNRSCPPPIGGADLNKDSAGAYMSVFTNMKWNAFALGYLAGQKDIKL